MKPVTNHTPLKAATRDGNTKIGRKKAAGGESSVKMEGRGY